MEPPLPRQGDRWRDHQQVINGICWVKRMGSPWAHMPARYGPGSIAHDRFRRSSPDSAWARLKAAVVALAEADGEVVWYAQADSTIVRAHQYAAGRKGAQRG
ncbi:hypothetical protein Asi02nite_65090 [Asanoa siamensis]|uniref:Insertion element IS402-like domain-containing protein n=1 Tax=Asanoa siamensis TaxID=926357 RepID=A0ABQ4D0D7_9ACTN|nr:hypothetical protein Asi02nite_65090 [Asanoa siamensis]